MKLFLVVVILMSQLSFASGECKATKFPFARKQKKAELKSLFDQLSRDDLKQYLFYEVTNASSDDLGDKILNYLKHTEQDKLTKGFFEAIQFGRAPELKDNKPVQNGVRVLKLQEVCELNEKLNEARSKK